MVRRMDAATSLWLDMWRLGAALVVFFGHVSGERLTGGLFWQVGALTGQAVTVFFVLSGFVIAYSSSRPGEDARSYTVARLARAYSVALPAVLLTFALDWVGRGLRPGLYSAAWGYAEEGGWRHLVAALGMVNQVWTLNLTPGSNLSYWSLGYEAWYYVVFAALAFAPGRWRVAWAALALAAAGPAIAVMLPLWLMGALGWRLCASGRVGPRAGWALLAGGLAAWVAYDALCRWGATLPVPALLRRPPLVEDYLVGSLFLAQLVGFAAVAPRFAGLARRVGRPVRWAAGATFTLYLLHLPLAQALAASSPWPVTSWPNRLLVFGGTALAVLAVAEVTERRKAWWHRAFDHGLTRLGWCAPQAAAVPAGLGPSRPA